MKHTKPPKLPHQQAMTPPRPASGKWSDYDVLLNDLARDLPALLGLSERLWATGYGTFNFAASNTAVVVVQHGLTVQPAGAVATCVVPSSNAAIAPYVTGLLPTQIGFGAYETSGAAITTAIPFYWVAWK